MATIASPASPSPHDDDNIPTGIPSIPTAAAASRRLPPPCWSPEETVALIDAYKNKWYSLRRGHLRANHWQEVADDVAARCAADPPKTAVQCRHKMEKLRKRYRAEIQRAAALGGARRFTSAWVHFQRMHAMEIGPNPTPPSSSSASSGDDDDNNRNNSIKRINDLYNRNQKFNSGSREFEIHPSSGVRIKFPGQAAAVPYPKFDQIGGQFSANPNPKFSNSIAGPNDAVSSKMTNPIPNPKFPNSIAGPHGAVSRNFNPRSVHSLAAPNGAVSGKSMTGGFGEILKNLNGENGVAAIRALGEGFMRVEKAKMDMVRQIEEMRMEMELKRTEMILDSQHRLVEAFAKAMSERSSKKAKRDSTNNE